MSTNLAANANLQMLSINTDRSTSFAPSNTANNASTSLSSSMAYSAPDSNMELTSPLNMSDSTLAAMTAFDGMTASGMKAGNPVTEFTKRKGWSALLINGFRDFFFIMSYNGVFKYASPSITELLGYSPEELIGKSAVALVHKDDTGMFVREFQESAATKRQMRFYYRCEKKDETYQMLECHAHPVDTTDSNQPTGKNNLLFFASARPYPTKSGALLDSFLEHKIEHIRLKRRIEELRAEEDRETLEEQQLSHRRAYPGDPTGSIASGNTRSTTKSEMSSSSLGGVSIGSFTSSPRTKGNALTRENLGRVDAASANRPDSMREKMARYEDATHLERLEMMTGLLYREGERADGISTGNASPSLIRGDSVITSPLDRERDISDDRDKKKKVKFTEEFLCRDCGTLESPEWRKGPQGPKSLCNACGLRWAKQEKRRNSVSSHPTGSA